MLHGRVMESYTTTPPPPPTRGGGHLSYDWLSNHVQKCIERVCFSDMASLTFFFLKRGVCHFHCTFGVPPNKSFRSIFKTPFEGIILSTIAIKIHHLGLCFAGLTPFQGENVTWCDMPFRVHSCRGWWMWVGSKWPLPPSLYHREFTMDQCAFKWNSTFQNLDLMHMTVTVKGAQRASVGGQTRHVVMCAIAKHAVHAMPISLANAIPPMAGSLRALRTDWEAESANALPAQHVRARATVGLDPQPWFLLLYEMLTSMHKVYF